MADSKISALASGAPAQAGDEYVVARSGANYKLTLTNIAANMPATTISSGNLIVSSGNVGIGTASPGGKLDVRDTNCIVYSRGTGGFGAFYATGSGTNASYLFMGNATSGEQGRITCENGGAIAFGNTASATERMRIDSSGNVGIGGTAAATHKVQTLGTLPTSSNASVTFGAWGTIPSGSTNLYRGYESYPSTQAASFTVANLHHFWAGQPTLGAGSAVTNQYGFSVDSSLTGATNNYGFYSNIASGSNRWNFYANGTAQNYFAGDTGVGIGPAATTRFRIRGQNNGSGTFSVFVENTTPTELFKIRDDGVFYTGLAGNSPYNLTTGSAANLFVDSDGALRRSTSSLRYKSNVTDAAHGLADVLKLRSVTYKAKNSGDTVFGGLIAEEVHDAGLTEFVAYDNEGRPDALHYGNMVALLVKAIQELSAKVAALEAK